MQIKSAAMTETDSYDLALRKFLRLKRQERELTQRELAALMRQPQSYVHKIEIGERRCTVGDFILFSKALKFDLRSAIRRIAMQGDAALAKTRSE